MINQPISNPKDFQVVEFVNSTDFDFTPEMGCMYDSRPIFGISGFAGIKAGERLDLPYHIGIQLAYNLAKQCMVRNAPAHDPTFKTPQDGALWTEERLEALKNSFFSEKYMVEKPTAMSETDRLIKQVEELNKLVRDNLPQANAPVSAPEATASPATYKDKAEVIAELTKRGITHNPRESKAKLEQLLA